MRNGHILITQVTAVKMVEGLQERYASSRLLLLPRSASGEYMAATHVDARLQEPDNVQVGRFARVRTRLACVKRERTHMDMDIEIGMLAPHYRWLCSLPSSYGGLALAHTAGARRRTIRRRTIRHLCPP